jgi:hypothetical protein
MGTIYLPHDAASVHPEATHSYEEQIRKLFPGANIVVVERRTTSITTASR